MSQSEIGWERYNTLLLTSTSTNTRPRPSNPKKRHLAQDEPLAKQPKLTTPMSATKSASSTAMHLPPVSKYAHKPSVPPAADHGPAAEVGDRDAAPEADAAAGGYGALVVCGLCARVHMVSM